MISPKLIPKKRGRPPGSKNINSKFARDQCMDILHEVATRLENKSLSVYQVLDKAAQEVIRVMLKPKPNDEQFRKTHLERVRQQLRRDQSENDNRYFSAASDAQEDFATAMEIFDSHDPEDGQTGPPPRPWEEALDDFIMNSEEDFRILPQGYVHAAMVSNAIVIQKRQAVKKRRLKQRKRNICS